MHSRNKNNICSSDSSIHTLRVCDGTGNLLIKEKWDIVVTNGRLVLKSLTDTGTVTFFNHKGMVVITKGSRF
jgi:hypothetical protein